MKQILTYFLLFILFNVTLHAQKPSYSAQLLLIPLDDRPPCLQFPTQMGLIGNVEWLIPPRPLLGKFTEFGKCEDIITWINQQDLSHCNAAIISMDMLAYGGLVASRVNATTLEQAIQRIEIVQKIRQKYPHLKIYGSSVIMRLAPTGDGKNEAYREKLARWADYAPYPEHKETVEKLEKEIPAEALENYKNARKRNLILNQKAIDWVKDGIFDYLILSQDDAKPKGIHIQDRETLIEKVEKLNMREKIAIQPGADEVSMLLLSRALTEKFNYHPKIKAIFSSDSMAQIAMPFEDRPLSKTVSFHIKAAGGVEVQDVNMADIIFYVFTSRHQLGKAQPFADLIQQNVKKGIIIADVDPIGDIQGGDINFTEGVLHRGIFSKIYGYACWNTAGNTIGTALPHGIVYGVSQTILKQKPPKKVKKSMAYAQTWFTLNRLLDDYAYHSIVRPKAQALIKKEKWNQFRLTEEQTSIIKAFCTKELLPISQNIAQKFKSKKGVKVVALHFDLPWNRTFEAEIDFKLD